MPKQSGYVLLLTLIFLQIFVIYSFLFLSASQMQLKLVKNQLAMTSYRFDIAHALAQVEGGVMDGHLACVVAAISWNELLQQSENWWKRNGCYLKQNQHTYYFIIEALGDDACTQLTDRQNATASYYRLTVHELVSAEQVIHLYWQSTIAKRAEQSVICQRKVRQIISGRQMLRLG